MSDDYPPRPFVPDAPRKKLVNGPRLIIYLLLLVVLIILFVPPQLGNVREPARRAEAKVNTIALNAALKAYHTEYNKWPDFIGDGLFLTDQRQGQLMRVLRNKDPINNPRRIVFFEGREDAESPGKYRNAFNRETNVFYDPWGQPYRIAIDTTGTGTIANPYPDDGPITASVIVWSLGKDGQQGAPANPRTAKGSDDVMSWQ